MLDTLRAFVAVNLDTASTRRVIALQRNLLSSPESPTENIAWVPPTRLHIAIQSFGMIDAALAPALGDALRESLRGLPSLRVMLVVIAAQTPPCSRPSRPAEARQIVRRQARLGSERKQTQRP